MKRLLRSFSGMSQNSVDPNLINFPKTVPLSLAHVRYQIAWDTFPKPKPLFHFSSCPVSVQDGDGTSLSIREVCVSLSAFTALPLLSGF